MANDEYELVPHKDIVELKEELNRLRGKPTRALRSVDNSVDELNKKLDRMLLLFDEASRQMNEEETEEHQIMKKLLRLESKVDTVSEQNEKIAEAILAIADMIGDQNKSEPPKPQNIQKPQPRAAPQNSNPFQMNPPGRQPQPPHPQPQFGMPPPMARPQQSNAPLPPHNIDSVPPPPISPPKETKKGFFSFKR